MATGTVVWVSARDGAALVAPEDGGRELFVLPADSADGFALAAAVEFEIAPGPRGRLVATNVVVAARPARDGE
jgi:cold shock CspA family protein